jgi:hypothetical protein
MCTKVPTSNDLEVSAGTGNNAIAGNNAISGSDVNESCCEVKWQKVTGGNGMISRTNVTAVAKQDDSW